MPYEGRRVKAVRRFAMIIEVTRAGKGILMGTTGYELTRRSQCDNKPDQLYVGSTPTVSTDSGESPDASHL